MENPETHASLGSGHRRRQTIQSNITQKTKNISNTYPTRSEPRYSRRL